MLLVGASDRHHRARDAVLNQFACASSHRSFQSQRPPIYPARLHLKAGHIYMVPTPLPLTQPIFLHSIHNLSSHRCLYIPPPAPTFISFLLHAPTASISCLCDFLLPTHLSEQGPQPHAVRLGGQKGTFQAESLLEFVLPAFRTSRGNF